MHTDLQHTLVALVIVYTIAEGIVLGVVKHRHAILNGLGNIALVAINLPIGATCCAVKTASIAWSKLKQSVSKTLLAIVWLTFPLLVQD